MKCPSCNELELRESAWISTDESEYESHQHYDCANCGAMPKDVIDPIVDRIAELNERNRDLQDTILRLSTEITERGHTIARLTAENRRLREGLSEALDWNWLDDDAPDNSHLLALLGGGKNEHE